MGSTNKTTYYELSQYVGSDKPTYLGDYNSDMLKIDTGLHAVADAADTALTTANSASSAATSASTTASTALSTAQSASTTASQAQTTAETALTNAGAAQTAAEEAETSARANVITNLAPAYDPSLTYNVGNLVTYVDAQGSGKMYKCIVAVTTPEAFNINKWDDVTSSEVFAKSDVHYVITHDFAASDTWSDVVSFLATNVDIAKLNTLLLDGRIPIIYTNDGSNKNNFTLCTLSTHLAVFNKSFINPYNNVLTSDTLSFNDTNSSANKYMRCSSDNSGNTITNNTTTALGVAITLKLLVL